MIVERAPDAAANYLTVKAVGVMVGVSRSGGYRIMLVSTPTRGPTMIERPWICEGCGHFMVSRTDTPPTAPTHECSVTGCETTFTAYRSSEHAAEIERRLAALERTPLL